MQKAAIFSSFGSIFNFLISDKILQVLLNILFWSWLWEFLSSCSACISLIAFWAWISKFSWLGGGFSSCFFFFIGWFSLNESRSSILICDEILQVFLGFLFLSWCCEFLKLGSAFISLVAFWTWISKFNWLGCFNSSWLSLNSDGGSVSNKGDESEEFHGGLINYKSNLLY